MKTFLHSIDNSLAIQKKAQNLIPGMTQLLSKQPHRFSYGVWPGYFSKAKGAEVWDLDGNEYIDMSISGIGANVLGYADPDVDAAVINAIKHGTSCSLNCPEEVELAELLCTIHPWADMVRYARTGGEAMAIAVRIARAFTGKEKIAFCGYHGWHDWYLAANIGKNDALKGHLQAGLVANGVPKSLAGTAIPFVYNDINAIKEIVHKNQNELSAIIMEPIRNEQPEPGFLEAVKTMANEIGAVFIIDEISSGFRMNTGGAHLLFGIEPDIAVFSKAIGNGYPIAAVIGKSKYMQAVESTFISSTNWTERIGPTAAIATILKHKKLNVAEHLMEIGAEIQSVWKKHANKHGLIVQITGIPPLSHLNFEYDDGPAIKALFVQEMLQKGFLASTSFYSMHAHTKQNVKNYQSAVDSTFAIISEGIYQNNIESRLIGLPSVAGFKRLS